MALSFGKEGRGFKGLGMLSGFWSSAPDLTPPIRIVIVCGCLFGVGVLVVNCIVDASIFDLCKQYWLVFKRLFGFLLVGWCCFCC